MSTESRKLNLIIVIAVALCITLVATVGGVWSYLVSRTDTVSNEFVPAKVTCEVEETFQNGVKENVCIKNTGNVNAFIRAAVVVTFEANDGKVLANAPVENADYTITWNTTDWQKGADGFWYHKKSVSPNNTTSQLIGKAEAVSVPDGYKLNIRILATAIQSDPESAVKEAWNVTVSGGTLILN